MKFCYVDESASSDGSVVVAAGIVVDAARMHLTKAEWADMLARMGTRLGAPLREFKAKDLYQGSGRWRALAPRDRGVVMGELVDWIRQRKHTVVYAGVVAARFTANGRPERADLPDTWCAADRHLLLALQRTFQSQTGQKGHTVVVIDRGGHESHLAEFVRRPEPWTDAYYARPPRVDRLSHIVDVPYFVDSAHAMLVQTADLYAYVLRRYVEITDLAAPERYAGERTQVTGWARSLSARAPRSDLYPTNGRTSAHDVFREIAPPSLVSLRP